MSKAKHLKESLREQINFVQKAHMKAVGGPESQAFERLYRFLQSLSGYLEERVAVETKEYYPPDPDLPPEITKLLKSTQPSDLEQKIIGVIKSNEEVDIDTVIIRLFKNYKYVPPSREYISNRLAATANRGYIDRVPKRKGIYKLPDEEDTIPF